MDLGTGHDELVQRRCWDGALVVHIECAEGLEGVQKSTVMHIRRHLYPFHLLERARPILLGKRKREQGKTWLSCRGVALLPSRLLGHSYDLDNFVKTEGQDAPLKDAWRLELHWEPDGREQREDECRSTFWSRLKEADLIRFGSNLRTNGLRAVDIDKLWHGLTRGRSTDVRATANPAAFSEQAHARPDEMELHHSVASQLWKKSRQAPSSTTTTARPPEHSGERAIDPRGDASSPGARLSPAPELHRNRSFQGQRGWPVRWMFYPDGYTVQEPIAQKDGEALSLQTVTRSLFPMLFSNGADAIVDLVIQGCRIPLEADFEWLLETMGDPDGWLSIVVVPAAPKIT